MTLSRRGNVVVVSSDVQGGGWGKDEDKGVQGQGQG